MIEFNDENAVFIRVFPYAVQSGVSIQIANNILLGASDLLSNYKELVNAYISLDENQEMDDETKQQIYNKLENNLLISSGYCIDQIINMIHALTEYNIEKTQNAIINAVNMSENEAVKYGYYGEIESEEENGESEQLGESDV